MDWPSECFADSGIQAVSQSRKTIIQEGQNFGASIDGLIGMTCLFFIGNYRVANFYHLRRIVHNLTPERALNLTRYQFTQVYCVDVPL